MTSFKWAVTVVLIAATAAMATSKMEFIAETGGDNHAAGYENGQYPAFTSGVLDGSTQVTAGDDLTWAVRVLVHSAYNDPGLDNLHADPPDGPGDFAYPLGAANIVFDVVVTDMADNPVQIGAGGGGTAGFHSTINDGDADGARGQGGLNPDPQYNGAFASVYNVGGNGANGGRLVDPPSDGGPNFDYWWTPSANGLPANSTAPLGSLIGFGAGMKDFDFGTNYIPGVGMFGDLNQDQNNCGVGLVLDAAAPQALFEGQIDTTGLGPAVPGPGIQYKLKIVADATGNNILHGDVVCDSQTFGAGSFAAKVNQVIVDETTFTVNFSEVQQVTEVVGRLLFYNQSFYDGNKLAIDAAPVAGANNDDDDGIDPSKSPLLAGGGLAQVGSWTSHTHGVNGLMFDIKDATDTIEAGDFTFVNQGRLGTSSTAVVPNGFLVRAGQGVGGSDRVVITFADDAVNDAWLQCTIGTGFGLDAADVCYWGNARGETNTPGATFLFVNVTDFGGVRDNQKASPANRPTVDEPYDSDKSGLTNITDFGFVRDTQRNSPGNAVARITR